MDSARGRALAIPGASEKSARARREPNTLIADLRREGVSSVSAIAGALTAARFLNLVGSRRGPRFRSRACLTDYRTRPRRRYSGAPLSSRVRSAALATHIKASDDFIGAFGR